MSEGGRKVWDREQLYALNDGAIILVPHYIDGKLSPLQVTHFPGLYGEDSRTTEFYEFGSELDTGEPTDYPIEVLWEPTEED